MDKELFNGIKMTIEHFTKEILKNPNNVYNYYYRADAKEQLGYYYGAVEDYNKVLELAPDRTDVYFLRGVAKYKQGEDYQDAIEDFNKALKLNPEDKHSYYNRGLAKHYLKDKEGACLDWNKAGELGYAKAYKLIKKYYP